MVKSTEEVKVYFVTIPAHKFLHVRNYESNGYWDFWKRQEAIPGQDCNTICGLLDSIRGKLDDAGSGEANSGSGQIMGYVNDPQGLKVECYMTDAPGRITFFYHDPQRFWKVVRPVRKG